MYTHTRTHTYTHTYTHAHTRTFVSKPQEIVLFDILKDGVGKHRLLVHFLCWCHVTGDHWMERRAVEREREVHLCDHVMAKAEQTVQGILMS